MTRSLHRTVSAATALTCLSLAGLVVYGGGGTARAQGSPPSAAVLASIDCSSHEAVPGVTPQQYFEHCRRQFATTGTVTAAAVQSVFDARVAVASANFSAIPSWSNARIREQFRRTRDTRFIYSDDDPSFIRRSSWMYPDNGCFARSELVVDHVADVGISKPYKLFSFATTQNLHVTTSNHPDGFVEWSWHVVPVVKSSNDGQIYVLDPAIEPSQPLPWQTWLLRQVPSLNLVQVTVADPNAYNPFSLVSGGPNQRTQAESDLRTQFLMYEWDRQEELGRNPNVVLGDNPPWKRQDQYFIAGDEFFAVVSSCLTCTNDAHALTQRCFKNCP